MELNRLQHEVSLECKLTTRWHQSLRRGQKVQSRREREIWYSFLQFREEKEKPEIPFPSFERRKRNLKKGSPLSRRERERGFLFSSFERRKRTFLTNLQFREEKEKSEILFSSFEKRKRNLEKGSPLSRREREMDIIFSRFERWKRIPTRLFEKFSLSPKLCQTYSYSQSESFTIISFSVRIVILAAMLCINHGNYFYLSEHTHV